MFVDIDSLLRPVYGHAKQGASFGHAKIAGKQLLRKGLSPLVTTISTAHAAPVIAEVRLRAGKTGSGRAPAAWSPRRSPPPAPPAPPGTILVRGDSAFGNREGDRRLRARQRREFSLSMTRNPAHHRRDRRHRRGTPTPRCTTPARCDDPDTGALISDAEVAEIPYTAFAATTDRITARLVVRRVKDARYPDALFPVWRYHPFFTNSDAAHRRGRHHPPPPRHHRDRLRRPDRRTPGPPPLRAVRRQLRLAALRGDRPQPAARRRHPRRPTPRRRPRRHPAPRLVNVPARFARPARTPVLHLPSHWPWAPRMAAAVGQHHRPQPTPAA